MRVCVVTHQFPPRFRSGTELYALRVARQLTDGGHDVRVWTGEPCFDELPRVSEVQTTLSGIPVRRVTSTPPVAPERVLAEYDSAWLAERFGRFIASERPDVVHVFHLKFVGAGVVEEAWLRGVPTVVHLCDFWPLCPRTTLLRANGALCAGPHQLGECIDCMSNDAAFGYRDLAGAVAAPEACTLRAERSLEAARARPTFLRRTLELADVLIAPSRALRDVYLENGYPERIELLEYAVADDLAPKSATTRRPGVRFGYVGSLLAHKGVDLLLRAFADLDWPDATLTLHGDPRADGAYGEELRRAAQRDRRVRLAGEFDPERLADVLASIDVLVVPSIWRENTPFVALEARATGTPVVGSRVDGLAEAIGEGSGAVLFDRGDATDLARKLRAFRDDPTLLERLRRQIKPVKRMSEHAAELLELYRRAADAHAVRAPEAERSFDGAAAHEARADRRAEILERRNRALLDQLAHVELGLARAVEEVDRRGVELDHRGDELELCRAEIDRRGRDIETCRAEIDHRGEQLVRRREEALDAIENLERRNRALLDQFAQIERGLASAVIEVERRGAELDHRGREIEACHAEIDHLGEELVRRREEALRAIDFLERRNRALREHLAQLEIQLTSAVAEVGRRGAELEHRGSELSACRAEIERRGLEIDQLTARTARLERGFAQRIVRALARLVGDRGERSRSTTREST